MTVIPFDERPASRSSLAVRPETPGGQSPADDKKVQAVAEILEHGVLSHAFGQHGDYKVRTTMTTRRTWQYRCCVLRHGKPIKGAFFPILAEHQPSTSRGSIKPLRTGDMRLNFAQEAVDVHFTRCAALQEYLVLSALYDQPSSQSRGWYTILAPLIGITMVIAYGFWAHAFRTDTGQPPGSLSPLVADRLLTREARDVPLQTPGSMGNRSSVNGQGGTSGPIDPAEVPKDVRLNDVLALQGPPEKANHASRAPIPGASPGSAAADIQAGDILRLTGWLHRISRTPDSTYHLYISSTRNSGARVLVATVPPPDQAQGSPVGQAQLQTVRTFIKQQLLRQQDPSLRGSVMKRPIFVQLKGQLSLPAASPTAPSQGRRSQTAAAPWEIRPLLEVQFATPSEASDRSRSQ